MKSFVPLDWLNSWHRADAINATNEIIGMDASVEEYNRVLEILQRNLGAESQGVKVAMDAAYKEQVVLT